MHCDLTFLIPFSFQKVKKSFSLKKRKHKINVSSKFTDDTNFFDFLEVLLGTQIYEYEPMR